MVLRTFQRSGWPRSNERKAKKARRGSNDWRYLAGQIDGHIIGPIVAFHKYIFPDVLPAFRHLDKRAEEVAQEYYETIGSQPAYGNEDFDLATQAEAAQDRSIGWYQMMVSLRQSMLNLMRWGMV